MKNAITKVMNKILALVVLLLCFSATTTYAVDILHQAWVQEDGVESYILFRTYTTPHPDSLTAYAMDGYYDKEDAYITDTLGNGKFYDTTTEKVQDSQWVYRSKNAAKFDILPDDHGQFSTYALKFHGEDKIGNYSNITSGTDEKKYGYIEFSQPILENLNDVSSYASATHKTSKIRKTPAAMKNVNFNDNDDVAYVVGNEDDPTSFGDPWFRMTFVAASVDYMNNDRPIYVTDRKLDPTMIANIKAGANTKGLYFSYRTYTTCLRVSNMLMAKGYDGSNDYDSMKTPYEFIYQGAGWGEQSLGIDNGGKGSAVNLYDNIIVLPNDAKRSIKIRHVNIENNEFVNVTSVESAMVDNKYIEETVPVDDNGEPLDLSQLRKRDNFGEEYLGYNVANMATNQQADYAVRAKVAAGAVENTSEQYVPGEFRKISDEYIVVEMYYRNKPKKAYENHMFYDENGNLQNEKTTSQMFKTDDAGAYFTKGSIKTFYKKDIVEEGYYFIGSALRVTEGVIPNLAEYDITKTTQQLVWNPDQEWDTVGKIAYFGYQKLNPVVERHVVYFKDQETGVIEGSEYLTADKEHFFLGTTEIQLNKLNNSFQYLGIIKNNTDAKPQIQAFNPNDTSLDRPASTIVRKEDNIKYVYFGYMQVSADIHVRHILYDTDGQQKKILKQYRAPIVADTTIERGNEFTQYIYKGYIKSNDDTIPSMQAYVENTSCNVKIMEVRNGKLYINFLYSENPTTVEVREKPSISVEAMLDIEPLDSNQVNTTSCESLIYPSSQGNILSVPIQTQLKFGIIKQPKYILGAVNIGKEIVNNDTEGSASITKSIAVVTNVTAHGLTQTQSLAVRSVYDFILPWKYSKYTLNDIKIFKLSESHVYSPRSENINVIGDPVFDKNVHKAFYNLNEGIKYKFNEGAKGRVYLTEDFEYEMYVDPIYKTECEDLHYGDVINCNAMQASSVSDEQGTTISSSISNILGITDTEDISHTIVEDIHVYASHQVDNGALGIFGMTKYTNTGISDPEKKYVTLKIDNNETVITDTLNFFEKIWGLIVEIFNGIFSFLADEGEEPAKIEWEPDEEKKILLQLAQNTHYYINGNSGGVDGEQEAKREVIFSLGMKTETNQSTLTINDKIIAQNKESVTGEAGKFSIDSSNFKKTSNYEEGDYDFVGEIKELISNLSMSYERRSYVLDGHIDFSNTGMMKITDLGKKYYTEGFEFVNTLENEAELNLDTTKTNNKTNGSNFVDTIQNNKNGLRIFAGYLKYNADKGETVDNLYYSDRTTTDTIYTFKSTGTHYEKEINKDQVVEDKRAVDILNIYTPIKVKGSDVMQNSNDEPESQLSNPIVEAELTENVILESGFKINIGIDSYNGKYGNLGNIKINEYLKGFYLKFKFDVKELRVNDNTDDQYDTMDITVNSVKYKGGSIAANTWIFIPSKHMDLSSYEIKVSAKSVNPISGTTSYYVRAVANNITTTLLIDSLDSSIDSFYETYQNICNDQYPFSNETKSDDSPVYYDEKEVEINVKSVQRLFDFRITDVKDIDWKDVFRNGTKHSGIAYYVGIRKYRQGYDKPKTRTAAEIGDTVTRLLPIGPYKEASGKYTGAPKLGYRFSFDVTLSGDYKDDRKVIIDPSFYYISKDGTTHIKDIDLYYKNEDNKYVKIGSTQDNYNLTFIPNDGYRLLDDGVQHLSTKSVSLHENLSGKWGITDNKTPLTRMVLKAKDMSTVLSDGTMTFYGEYKLPNSTIAVEDGEGIQDSSKYLKNGYIGVIFDIYYFHNDKKESKISYSSDMKKITSPEFSSISGTSQWEYEGFLGYKYNFSNKNASIKLEKGRWNISDTDNLNKDTLGTVILFDIDNRAATDFN